MRTYVRSPKLGAFLAGPLGEPGPASGLLIFDVESVAVWKSSPTMTPSRPGVSSRRGRFGLGPSPSVRTEFAAAPRLRPHPRTLPCLFLTSSATEVSSAE